MTPQSVGLLQPQGFRQKTSKIAIAWMSWMKRQLGLVSLNHGRNSIEAVVRGVKLDGYGRDQHGGLVLFEMNGCL
jgi:hypothetical protein